MARLCPASRAGLQEVPKQPDGPSLQSHEGTMTMTGQPEEKQPTYQGQAHPPGSSPYPGSAPYPAAPPAPGVFYPPGTGAPGQAGFRQPHNQPNALPPAGWGSNPGYGAWPPSAGKPPSKWFGMSAWEASMAKQAHATIRNLIIGLVLFLLAIGFIVFAAVANNFDQVKGLLGM